MNSDTDAGSNRNEHVNIGMRKQYQIATFLTWYLTLPPTKREHSALCPRQVLLYISHTDVRNSQDTARYIYHVLNTCIINITVSTDLSPAKYLLGGVISQHPVEAEEGGLVGPDGATILLRDGQLQDFLHSWARQHIGGERNRITR